ncbi:MAG: hypothetical protein J6Q89_06865 [Clostridia bacterium]|nr:hypothetical protein [Clostridia bacterium]
MDDKPSPRSKEKKNTKKKGNTSWIVLAFSLSFIITAIMSAASDKVVSLLPLIVAALVLITIISLGIIFDIIGLAVATADIAPFNSMAARRLKTGQTAVWLIKNAEKVSSFCNDIVGDIAGVVSGATGAGIAVKLFINLDSDIAFLLTLALTSLISAFTVGGKALGKSVALNNNVKIVTAVAKVLCGFRK